MYRGRGLEALNQTLANGLKNQTLKVVTCRVFESPFVDHHKSHCRCDFPFLTFKLLSGSQANTHSASEFCYICLIDTVDSLTIGVPLILGSGSLFHRPSNAFFSLQKETPKSDVWKWKCLQNMCWWL